MKFVQVNSRIVQIEFLQKKEHHEIIRREYMVWDFHRYCEGLMVHYHLLTIIHKQQKMEKQVKEDLIKAKHENDLL
jgi:hypothetical protein